VIRTDNQLAMGCRGRTGKFTGWVPNVAGCSETTLDGISEGEKHNGRERPTGRAEAKEKVAGEQECSDCHGVRRSKNETLERSKKTSLYQTSLHMKQVPRSLVPPRESLFVLAATSLEL
jgi:hypothetical protein